MKTCLVNEIVGFHLTLKIKLSQWIFHTTQLFFFGGGGGWEGRGGRLGHLFAVVWSSIVKCIEVLFHACYVLGSGADPGLFLGGGALVSCSTSTPINLIVFFFSAEYQLY